MSRARFRALALLVPACLAAFWLLSGSTLPPGGPSARVRAFTRSIEFDFANWTLSALAQKAGQLALSAARYLPPEEQGRIVLDYVALIRNIQDLEGQVSSVYADPQVADADAASASAREELDGLDARRTELEPLAESVMQTQLQAILAETGFTLGGQSLPPILYKTSPPPLALIVSPRDVIRRDHHISIESDLTTDAREGLESQIDESLGVSSLTVPVGGIGLYPTMIMQTADVNFLAEVVAHEWIHNYLTLRPLGALYMGSPQMMTINETVASIAGKELGRRLVERFYPEFLPPPPAPPVDEPDGPPTQDPPPFDFRREMGETRRTVDALLEDGNVEEAEAYMESRRQVFWDNGYRLRKLNQAYFAFYGSYADEPGGAAGVDPVGEAVRTFRSRSPSLTEFVKRISWITSFEALQELLERPGH
ncbi:MAG TPA: hypothetical protein VJ768_10435 [Anaerolineales bacterium]|nr:hypothetical protein [Anaerolineales bacterium]